MTWCWCAPAAGHCCTRALQAAMLPLLLGPARRGRKSRNAAQTAVRRRRWLCCHPLQLPGRSHGLPGAFPAAQLLLRLLCGDCSVASVPGDCCWCITRDPFAAPRLVFVSPYGAYARSQSAGAAALLGGARAVCTAATRFADVAALAIAELSTTEALAARVIRLLPRGLFSCRPTVPMRDRKARVQRHCSGGRYAARLCNSLDPHPCI